MLLAGFLFASCSDVNLNSVNQPEKGKFSLIPIPGKAGLTSEAQFSTSALIDGSVGGSLSMDQSYLGTNGNQVTLHVLMTIPAGAFTGQQTITLTADDQYAALKCYPAMVFSQSLSLDFSYTGLTLNRNNLANGVTGFYFIADDGTIQPVSSKGVVVNVSQGRVAVNNAKIDHFSRYGWGTLDGFAQ